MAILWDVLVLMDKIEDAGTAVEVENLVFSIRKSCYGRAAGFASSIRQMGPPS
jgi:hypothetical protein